MTTVAFDRLDSDLQMSLFHLAAQFHRIKKMAKLAIKCLNLS